MTKNTEKDKKVSKYSVDMGERGKYDTRNRLNDLTSREWIPETISVFTQKGLGASHKDTAIERLHPAPFSYQDVQRLINFFTKKNDLVLDPFCGVGSTLKACALSNRRGLGFELMKKYCDLTKKRFKNELVDYPKKYPEQKVIHGDALKEIKKLNDNELDFIVTSPPYWNILEKIDHKAKQERVDKNLDTKYSEKNKYDLASIKDYKKFIETLGNYFHECSKKLKDKKYICIIISDFRHKERFYTFHTDLSSYIETKGNLSLKGITVLYQSRKNVYPYGYPYAYVPNIHHQYILIMQNNKDAKRK
jgi:DNA modification methylase